MCVHRGIQVDDEGRASRRAMLEYKRMMKAADEARREKVLEEQRRAQAAKNAEQRAEGQIRRKLAALKAEDDKREARHQDTAYRLQAAVRLQALGHDRDHTAYWWLGDTPRVYCEGEGRWGYIDRPEELDSLVSSLDVRGIRECHLSTSLGRHYRAISAALRRRQEEQKRDEDNRRSSRIQTKTKEMGFAYYVNTLRK
jgi:hypothetical protein